MPAKAVRALTPKQQRFVQEYLIDLNASAAAKRAGYSVKTADQLGYQLLQNPLVAAAISAGRQVQAERAQVDADWLLGRLEIEANADLADLYDEKGALKPVKDWPLIWRQGLIAGVETAQEFEEVDGRKVQTGLVHKVKISDRAKRLELIGRHRRVGAWIEKHEHTGADGGPIETKDVSENEAARRIAFILAQGMPVEKPN
jgi:phage terminase small subunit